MTLAVRVADAVRIAANELETLIRWGCVWDIDFTISTESPEDLVEDYVARRKASGLRAFIDGPHFELSKSE